MVVKAPDIATGSQQFPPPSKPFPRTAQGHAWGKPEHMISLPGPPGSKEQGKDEGSPSPGLKAYGPDVQEPGRETLVDYNKERNVTLDGGFTILGCIKASCKQYPARL